MPCETEKKDQVGGMWKEQEELVGIPYSRREGAALYDVREGGPRWIAYTSSIESDKKGRT